MDDDRIMISQAKDSAYQECAFDIWFTKKYADAIATLESLEEDFAMSWLQFGAKHFSGMEWSKGDAFIFVPSSAEQQSRRRRNRRGNKRRRMH